MLSKSRHTQFAIGLVLALPLSAGAWTGPTGIPPAANVEAPINVSLTNQFKPGTIGANSLNLYGSSQYLSFGTTIGPAGFGLRNNAGVLEFKGDGGTWGALTILGTGSVGIGGTPGAFTLDVLGFARAKTFSFYGPGVDSGSPPNYYGMYQEAGAFVAPYPDLRISYHTGISYDAYMGYGGHRFFTSYDGTGNPYGLQLQITDKTHASRLTAGGVPGSADQTYYDIGAGRIAANESIYSYGSVCAGNSAGNCAGVGGIVISAANIKFPDGTTQSTAAGGGQAPCAAQTVWWTVGTANCNGTVAASSSMRLLQTADVVADYNTNGAGNALFQCVSGTWQMVTGSCSVSVYDPGTGNNNGMY